MHFRNSALAVAIACALAATSATAQQAGSNPATPATAVGTPSSQADAMQRLQAAASGLEQSIRTLAQQPAGPDRLQAIASAHQALLRTQQAMMTLPAPELRSGAADSSPGYADSVRKLRQSAQNLRQAIDQMAQQPAGERRNDAIQEAHRALWEAQEAMMAAYLPNASTQAMGAAGASSASGARAGGSSQHQQASGSAAAPAAVLVLLPTAQATDTRLADGCWVRFFDDKNFKGDTLTLAGPVDMPRMELGDIWRDWDSAVVGPKATITAFDNEGFNDRSATLRPGQSIADLGDRKLGWFEEIKSTRVSCAA